jgi:hypothetical protein
MPIKPRLSLLLAALAAFLIACAPAHAARQIVDGACQETSDTSGPAIDLGPAAQGYQTIAAAGGISGNSLPYQIRNGTQRAGGWGVFTDAATDTFTLGSYADPTGASGPDWSSNGGAALVLSGDSVICIGAGKNYFEGGSGNGLNADLLDGISSAGFEAADTDLASIAGTAWVQGDLPYLSGTNAWARLAKDTNATRYLSNTGTSNNPAWAQVDLSNGVTGDLPFANLTQIAGLSVLCVTGSSTADVAACTAGSDHQVLRRSGSSIAFGAVNLAQANAVTGTLGLGNGGTGGSTAGAAIVSLCGADPNADRFAFWDDSAGACAWLTPPTNLIISGTSATIRESFVVAASDETTTLTTGSDKVTFRMPYAFTVTGVRCALNVGQTGGSLFTVDINENNTSILSTKVTIDNNETTSTTAATAPVISDSAIADDAEVEVDIDTVGTGSPAGLKCTLIGNQ